METAQKITPHFWFDTQAREAVEFYTSVFKNSRVLSVTRYGKAGAKVSGMREGQVMTVQFELEGQKFLALNGGPAFKFTEAVSFVIDCHDQNEIDYYWQKLTEGGDEKAQICGWLKDKYGVSWQVIPVVLGEMMQDKDPKKTERVMEALLKMKKIEIDVLKKAYERV